MKAICTDCGETLDGLCQEPKLTKLQDECMARWEKDRADYALRSCWACNPGHKHLKKSDYPIRGFCCGHLYLNGHRISTTEEERP